MARIALAALALALLAVPSTHAVTFYSKETKTSPIVGFTGPLTTVMNDVRSPSLTLTPEHGPCQMMNVMLSALCFSRLLHTICIICDYVA